MEQKSLKNKITSGLIWTYLERVCAQGVSALVTIILARILVPQDYAVVSIITIFMTICDSLVVGGFSDTLIQKKDADSRDFSTLYWFVLVLGIAVYGIIFAGAPLVEKFFDTRLVCVTLRVLGVRIPISAIKSIQSAYISRNMKYKYFFIATSIGTVVSAVVGIVMAYLGFGVWALIAQYLTNSVIDTVIVSLTCGWKPEFVFDVKRLKSMYTFGWKMQVSTILAAVYGQVESLCIGKKYTSVNLAFYEKGKQFPQLIMHNVQSSIGKVMLPAFSKVNDEKEKMKELARKSVRTSSYVMFPLLIGLMACADEFVMAVLTEKWMPSVPFLRILTVYFLFDPIMSLNKQIVIASGDSKKYLLMEIEKKSIGITLIIAALLLFDNVISIAIVCVVNQIIGVFIQSAPLKKIINYPISQQLRDLLPVFLLSAAMVVPVLLIKFFVNCNSVPKLVLEVLSGMIVYVLLSWLTKNAEFYTLKGFVKSIFSKLNRKTPGSVE